MAKISLRAYNREIEEMIAHNQFDQAIAHCRNILTIYPKHINTYRLLGKSFLENQRYGDAGDIFQRVLSSFPEDFISHVGMSIIREDEGNLDDALWHMERAFELQPSNNAVQGELRRLHGKREGVEPLKIRLTRGALAQMYLRGDLYVQAIAELRIALTEDPSRFDLQTNLAKAYYLSGQLAEAAKICNEIINKLPYSYEANRILAEIYKKSDRLPEAQPFLQKLYELDPYYAHLTENAPTPDQVNDSEVILEKLDWQPGAAIPMIATQPEWATSIGISMDNKETPDENLPDWLTSTEETTQKPIEEIKPVGELLEEEEEKTQPDWLSPEPSAETPGEGLEVLKESEQISEEFSFPGEEPSQEETIQFTEDEDKLAKETDLSGVEEIAPAEIPDWLQSLAPDQSQKPLEVSKGVSAIPSAAEKEISWLEETASVEEEPIIEALESTEPFITSENEAEETPTWLQQSDIQPEMLHSEIFEPEKEEFLSEVSTSDDSTEPFSADRKDDFAWLSESDINQSESEPIEEDSLWIEEPEEENLARINAEDDIAPAEEVELPEWLSQMKHDMEAKAQAAKSEEEIPGWLNTIDEPPISEEDTKPSRLLKKLRPEAIFPSGASTPEISSYEPSGIAEETPLSSIFSDESLEFKEEAREIDSAEFSETNETEKQLEWISEISSEKPFETELSEETGKDFYPEETEEIQKETSPVEEVQLPDWLSQVSDETIEKTAPILEQKPDWLSEEPLEPIEEPEKKEEEKPIWLSEEPLEPIEEPEKKVEEKLIWVSEEPLEPIEEPEKKEEEKPIWLSDEPLEPIEEPEKKEEEKPTWLSEEPFEPAEEPENKE
ncbi:MAG: tetratricopeptide repeat protein [Chloroflexi bacterium]|nr:tetratricopeptide repeat protein [Chloroflexota bacterium]